MQKLLTSSPQRGAQRLIVPYIATWTEERELPSLLVQRPTGGIAYADETLNDRDRHDILWQRTLFRPGHGRPQFDKVHPVRQRRAMLRLLCQVCAEPADHNDDGVLWLLKDHRHDWPDWPARMGVVEPPICLNCAHVAARLCPALRRGAVLVRARRHPVSGVRGTLYRPGCPPRPIAETLAPLDDPAIRWVHAANVVRELNDCTIVS